MAPHMLPLYQRESFVQRECVPVGCRALTLDKYRNNWRLKAGLCTQGPALHLFMFRLNLSMFEELSGIR